MTDGAHVNSISAVRDFRAAMCTFADEAREALATYDMELRRTLEWLLEDQPRFWREQVRRSEEIVVQAKIELETRRNTRLPGGAAASCIDEIKALDRARRRLRFAQDKVELVRRLGAAAQRESNEYTARANQLGGLFDASLPKAIAMLENSVSALEAYAALRFDRSTERSASSGQTGDIASRALPIDGPVVEGQPVPPADVNATGEPHAEESTP